VKGKTVLFVGAGRHQRRAILRAKELELRVVAVDRNPDAPGLQAADVGEVVDFQDLEGVIDVARRHGVDGALTVSADRAVPIVAAVAEELGLPGIGTEVAHLMTHKIAMRRRLAEAGVPQPRFAAARDLASAHAAAETVGFPAVLKPADSGGQRGIFRLESIDDLDAHLHAALAESAGGEVVLERFHDGLELNGLVIARGGEAEVLTLSDRLRPPGIGFGVGWIHVYPTTIFGDVLAEAERVAAHATHALGLRDGIAFPQLLVTDEGVLVIEVAARIPGGQMADLARHAVGAFESLERLSQGRDDLGVEGVLPGRPVDGHGHRAAVRPLDQHQIGAVVAVDDLDQGIGDGIGHLHFLEDHIRKTPKRVAGIGALSEAAMARPRTSRV